MLRTDSSEISYQLELDLLVTYKIVALACGGKLGQLAMTWAKSGSTAALCAALVDGTHEFPADFRSCSVPTGSIKHNLLARDSLWHILTLEEKNRGSEEVPPPSLFSLRGFSGGRRTVENIGDPTNENWTTSELNWCEKCGIILRIVDGMLSEDCPSEERCRMPPTTLLN